MDTVKGRVVFFGMKATRALQRYAERQVEKWIEREQTLLFLPKAAIFTVQVERSNEFPHYECAIEVKIGAREWRSIEGGRTLQDALKTALTQLKATQLVSFSKVSLWQNDQNIVA